MGIEETGGGSSSIQTVAPRYPTPKARYSPPVSTPPPPVQVASVTPVLEAQTARYEIYPNEIAVFTLANNLGINNDSETTVTFDTTISNRYAYEQSLQRDMAGLQRISVLGTPSGSVFEIFGFVRWAADADGYRQIAIDNNDGAAYQILDCRMAVSTASILTAQAFRLTVQRQEADTYYVLKARHTAGAALNIVAAQFGMIRIK